MMADEDKRLDSEDEEGSSEESTASGEGEQSQDERTDTESGAEYSSTTESAPTSVAEAETSDPPKAQSNPQAAEVAALKDADEDEDDHHPVHESSHGHGDDHFAHVLPMSLLVGVLLALILLTVLTVGVTAVDLGSQGNFVVAMIIATVKAALVMGYFMHMVWDSKFNVVAFTSSFLFVLLFLAMAVLDRSEYRDNIDQWEADQRIEAMQ